MKILITGNLGYVGPGLIQELRAYHPDATLIGFDLGFFSKYVTSDRIFPESLLDVQYYGDVRDFPEKLLEGVDAVISLAAISNDPIGNRFEEPTLDINFRANVALAEMAKKQGVSRFVFASSCSVYGTAEDAPRVETSELAPLTAYARSKVLSEEALQDLASEDFVVSCLRFATACGMSDRLRLDLVLNDFAAGAFTQGHIKILSDGTPWRPLIHVLDMARALRWGVERGPQDGGSFVVVNAGSNEWNYMIRELAEEVQKLLPEISVSINKDAEPDKRSYRVNFDQFERLAPNHQPQYDLKNTIDGLLKGLRAMNFADSNFHDSELIRLNVIRKLISQQTLDNDLRLVSQYHPLTT